jgi:hypothetical protein
MLITVNKKVRTSKPVKYAALSSGTISAVWYDETSDVGAKRQNHIRMTRDTSKQMDQYDA